MTSILRRYRFASYLVAVLFVVMAVLDAATNAWPWSPGSEQWRYGAAAILSGYLISIIFGLLLMGVLAQAFGHRRTQYAVSAVSGLLAILLLGGLVTFILDTLQLRGVVREEQLSMFKIGAAKTAAKIGLSFLAAVAVAVAAWKAARDTGEANPPKASRAT